MKNCLAVVVILASLFLVTYIFSSCTKDPDSMVNTIQQGDSVIEINAIYAHIPDASPRFLQVRYNNIISAAINLTIAFHLRDGQQHNIPISIPAGYRNLQSWGTDDYLNVWEGNGGYDSISNPRPPTPEIDAGWDVDFITIESVTCSDKKYGFKVLTGTDDWNFYHPKDPKTLISFISNADTITYSDYDFRAGSTIYRENLSAYGLYFFSFQFFMGSAPASYPLQVAQTLDISHLVYYWNGRNFGSQPDGPEADSNGSTLKLNITNVTDKSYDATFSGKVWSSRQPDTLFISNGVIKNARLPVTQ